MSEELDYVSPSSTQLAELIDCDIAEIKIRLEKLEAVAQQAFQKILPQPVDLAPAIRKEVARQLASTPTIEGKPMDENLGKIAYHAFWKSVRGTLNAVDDGVDCWEDAPEVVRNAWCDAGEAVKQAMVS